MTKKFGHTKTLFIQNGTGKYKWSYKFEYCIKCNTCNFKHKGRGLCTSCFDKERKIKSSKRKFNLAKQNWKHYYKTRVLMFLDKKEHKKTGPKTQKSESEKKEYKNKWYTRNFERISIIRKAERRLKNNLPCLKVIINGKEIYLPFESLEKPKTVGSKSQNGFTKEYFEWEENLKQFEIVTAFYRNKNNI